MLRWFLLIFPCPKERVCCWKSLCTFLQDVSKHEYQYAPPPPSVWSVLVQCQICQTSLLEFLNVWVSWTRTSYSWIDVIWWQQRKLWSVLSRASQLHRSTGVPDLAFWGETELKGLKTMPTTAQPAQEKERSCCYPHDPWMAISPTSNIALMIWSWVKGEILLPPTWYYYYFYLAWNSR